MLQVTANTIELASKMSVAPSTSDTFNICRQKSVNVDATGNSIVTSTPIKFLLDSVEQEVTEDTGTPSNNRPLPVKLTGVTGDINITANDLNVQTDHADDSVRLGDGTTLTGVTLSNELKTKDTDAETAINALLTEMQLKADLSETQPVSAASLPLPSGASTEVTLAAVLAKILAAPSTEAKQDTINTSLGTILAKIIAAPSTEAKQDTLNTTLGTILTELALKADLTETQPVSQVSQPLPTGASTETTLASILAKIIAAPSTEAKQDTLNTTLGTILTELQLKSDLSETQPVSAASLPLPSGASTEATLANADTTLTDRLSGSLVPAKFDYIALTYVAAGNGEGEVETAVYKTGGSGGATQATLTLTYDADNKVSTVTKA